MRHELQRVARLCQLPICRLTLLVLVAEHLLPSLPGELVVAVVDWADVALEDELVAARGTLASLEEASAMRAVALAARARVALERPLAVDGMLLKLASAARQQRRHQRLLGLAHGRIALDAQLGG